MRRSSWRALPAAALAAAFACSGTADAADIQGRAVVTGRLAPEAAIGCDELSLHCVRHPLARRVEARPDPQPTDPVLIYLGSLTATGPAGSGIPADLEIAVTDLAIRPGTRFAFAGVSLRLRNGSAFPLTFQLQDGTLVGRAEPGGALTYPLERPGTFSVSAREFDHLRFRLEVLRPGMLVRPAENGSFAFKGLDEGNYSMVVYVGGEPLQERPLTLARGSRLTVGLSVDLDRRSIGDFSVDFSKEQGLTPVRPGGVVESPESAETPPVVAPPERPVPVPRVPPAAPERPRPPRKIERPAPPPPPLPPPPKKQERKAPTGTGILEIREIDE